MCLEDYVLIFNKKYRKIIRIMYLISIYVEYEKFIISKGI